MATANKNIWTPSGTTNLTPLQTPFATLAQSVDDALVATDATIPSRPATSAANRDALIPSPVQGSRVWRTDLGYEEVYFALYNATTNPAGRTTPGWQTEEFSVRALVYRTSGINVAANTVTAIPWIAEYWDTSGAHADGATTLVAPVSGTYAVDYQIDISTNSLVTAVWIAASNSGARFATSEAYVKNHTGSATIALAKGDNVQLMAFSPGIVAVATSAVASTFGFSRVGIY